MSEKDREVPGETGLIFIGALILAASVFVLRRLRLALRRSPVSPSYGSRTPPLTQDQEPDTEPALVAGDISRGDGLEQMSTPLVAAEIGPLAPGSGAPETEGGISEPHIAEGSGATNRWTPTTRYMATAGIVLFIIWLIIYSQRSLSLLIFAALIALLSQPIIRFLQRRFRMSSGVAVLVTYLLIAIVLVMIPIIVLPGIIQGVNSLLDYDWQGMLSQTADTLDQSAAEISTIPTFGVGLSAALESLSVTTENLLTYAPTSVGADVSLTDVLDSLGKAIGVLESVVGPMISGALSLIFMFLISLQMSLASDQIRGWIMDPVPARFREEIGALLDRIHLVWVSFMHGQFALMIVMGVLVWLMNVLLGTSQPILLGILAGLLEVIPSVGPTLAAIPAAILALLFGSSHFPGLEPWIFMMIVILGYVLLNLVENQVLVPRILGSAVELPPLIVLIGVTIAGAKAGIVGIFLAVPIIATGREILEYIYNKIIEVPELDVSEPEKLSLIGRVRGYLGRIRIPFRRKEPAGMDVLTSMDKK